MNYIWINSKFILNKKDESFISILSLLYTYPYSTSSCLRLKANHRYVKSSVSHSNSSYLSIQILHLRGMNLRTFWKNVVLIYILHWMCTSVIRPIFSNMNLVWLELIEIKTHIFILKKLPKFSLIAMSGAIKSTPQVILHIIFIYPHDKFIHAIATKPSLQINEFRELKGNYIGNGAILR